MTGNSNNTQSDLDALRIDPNLKGKREKEKRWLIPLVVLVAIAVTAAIMLMVKNRGTAVELLTVKASVEDHDAAVLTASGYVEPRRKATVAAKITGQIKEMSVEEGMVVEKDQVLARLDDSEAAAGHRSAAADFDVAKATVSELRVSLKDALRTLKRKKELHNEAWISQAELDTAETAVQSLKAGIKRAEEQVKAARARVEETREALKNHTIRAPFSGIAISKDAQVGEMVSPVSAGGGYTRTGISTIVDMNSLEIEVDVNESYIAKVTVGQQVTAVLDAYQDWKIPARVRTIIPSADRQKATVKVRISFEKLDPRILPDMGIKVYFLGKQSGGQPKPLILLPKTALLEKDDKTYVFVYKDGHVERRAVSTGTAFEKEMEITAGLVNGEQVVTNSINNLKDGQRVKVEK